MQQAGTKTCRVVITSPRRVVECCRGRGRGSIAGVAAAVAAAVAVAMAIVIVW
jgi:tRNA(Met) C34 N-acetyltransferase TmcA